MGMSLIYGLLKYHLGKTDKLVLNLDLGSVGGLCLCVLVEVVLFLFGGVWSNLDGIFWGNRYSY